MKLKRLFVGNIPKGTTEKELSFEFCAYGVVKSVDLKSKPNAKDGGDDIFAFVNIEIEDQDIWKCITEFKQQPFKGAFLNVTKAKESFLDRLKREREEAENAKQNSSVLNPYKNVDVKKEEVRKPVELPTLPTIKAEDKESSSESSESESEDEKAEEKHVPFRQGASLALKPVRNEDELIRKWNQEAYIEHGLLKIVPITGKIKEVIEKSKNKVKGKEFDAKSKLADEKRKEAMSKLTNTYEQQRLAIKSALSGEVKTNKIIFDEDDDELAKKKTLFDDEDENDDFEGNFSVKKQFEGEKGQRLYEMQTQFKGDQRFKMNEMFLDDDNSGAKTNKNKRSVENEDERKKQLEILSKVTGKQFQDNQFEGKQKSQKSMQRFDPTKQESRKDRDEDHYSNKKRKLNAENDFKVSDEKFYKVSENIGQVISSNNEGFSLMAMLGRDKRQEEASEMGDRSYNENPINNKRSFNDARFKYESEDSDDENAAVEKAKGAKKSEEEPQKKSDKKVKTEKKETGGYYSNQGIWKETFFLLPDDPRLEEGKLFFMAPGKANQIIRNESKSEDIRGIKMILKRRKNRSLKIVNQVRKRHGIKILKK